VPVADLPIFSLGELGDHDTDEAKRLFDACLEYGFFLLDLKSSKIGESLFHDAENCLNSPLRLWAWLSPSWATMPTTLKRIYLGRLFPSDHTLKSAKY